MVLDVNWRTPKRLRSAKNVSKCDQNAFGARVTDCYRAGFITPRSAVRSRPPLLIFSNQFRHLQQNTKVGFAGVVVKLL